MTTGAYFRSTMIVFASLCLGPIIFAIVVSIPGISNTSPELYNILQWIVPIGGITEIAVFKFIKRKRFATISGNLQEKAEGYRAIMITTWASHEGAIFFAIIAFMLTSELVLLIYALLFFVLMLPEAPRKSHFINAFDLSNEELKTLNDDNAKLF